MNECWNSKWCKICQYGKYSIFIIIHKICKLADHVCKIPCNTNAFSSIWYGLNGLKNSKSKLNTIINLITALRALLVFVYVIALRTCEGERWKKGHGSCTTDAVHTQRLWHHTTAATEPRGTRRGRLRESSHGPLLCFSPRQVWPPHPSPRRHLLPIDQFVTNLIPSVYVNNAPLPLPRPHKLARFFPGRRRSCSNYCWMGASPPAVS